MYELSEDINLDKNKKHNIEIIVDRLVIKEGIESRLTDSIETSFSLSSGIVIVDVVGGEELIFSQNYSCPEHNISIQDLEPVLFSFNSPQGACPACTGLGYFLHIDSDLILPDKNLSIRAGAINAPGWNTLDDDSIAMMYYKAISDAYNVSLDIPVKDISKDLLSVFLYGTGDKKIRIKRPEKFGGATYEGAFEGVINNLERRYRETNSEYSRNDIESYMCESECSVCHGKRLKSEALSVTVGDVNISELTDMSVNDILRFFENLTLTEHQNIIGERIIKEIKNRLEFLKNVGLEYLTLSRPASTLSGGESQRIRLATQIGSSLTGVLYVLDEPSIGLHQHDNQKLINTLKKLRDSGNTLIVVEHDDDTILSADYVVDVGIGAGVNGGNIVFSGNVDGLLNCKDSITGQYLSGIKKIPVPTQRRIGNGLFLKVRGASEHNLKNIDVDIPLGTFTCVTGVSGSGKSSLVNEIIYKYLSCKLNHARNKVGKFDMIDGIENLDKVINIDQSPIGRTPRSNPATYTGVFTDIRELFAKTADAKAHGYSSSRFSFNLKGGRCESCEGDGILKIPMHFLPDVYVPCEVCKGKRYNHETLDIHYKGKSIYDVLEMTVDESILFFENIPRIAYKLKTLQKVGLGYIKLGQSATTLSGGEAQRVKLSTELSKRSSGKSIYILDEPTTGLHSFDVHNLITILQELVNGGNTVLVIEHNLHVIKSADYIIDLGPNGGIDGGNIVVCGTPEQVSECSDSYTGMYLRSLL
jgi:excinuclease ABC subunit A